MFVRNKTSHKVTLARGNVSDAMGIATIVVETVYQIGESGSLRLLEGRREAKATDPPDISIYPLWHEVGVTVVGTVWGPAKAPFLVPVTFRAGQDVQKLVVFGERRWEASTGGGVVASEAARFESMPLSFDRAFGGFYELAPGPDPQTKLPHPGGKVGYAANPDGRGFYADEKTAMGSPLPNIELADQLIKSWEDRPEPGGFAPCPKLMSLRMPASFLHKVTGIEPGTKPPEWTLVETIGYAPLLALRMLHYAPGRLIFGDILPGTNIEVTGVGKLSIRFVVPKPQAMVVTATGDKPSLTTGPPIEGRLRSIFMDADAGTVMLMHGHTMTYRRGFSPEWLRVLPAEG